MVDINLKVPAIEKLLDITVSGVGAVAGPMLARRKAQSEADALRIKAEGQADAIRLITDAQTEARKSLDVDLSSIQGELDVHNEIQARLSFQEEKRQRNIQAVVGIAADEIKDKEVQDHEIDHDWTARFFADVQDVSSEQMQKIWAKILAGEVEIPGRTSMQTLSILKNMSQKDAELFQNVAHFIIQDFVLDNDEHTKMISGFPMYSDFLRLSHHDLVHLGMGLQKTLKGSSEYHFDDGDIVYRISKNGMEAYQLNIPCHALTPSGKELYTFVNCGKNDDYLGTLAGFLSKKGKGKLAYAQILDRTRAGWKIGPLIDVKPHFPAKQE